MPVPSTSLGRDRSERSAPRAAALVLILRPRFATLRECQAQGAVARTSLLHTLAGGADLASIWHLNCHLGLNLSVLWI